MQTYNFSSQVICIPAQMTAVAHAQWLSCTSVSSLELKAEVTFATLSNKQQNSPLILHKTATPGLPLSSPLCVQSSATRWSVVYLEEAEPLVQTSSEHQLTGRVKLHRLHHRLAGLLLVGVPQPGSLNQPWSQLLVLAQKRPCP